MYTVCTCVCVCVDAQGERVYFLIHGESERETLEKLVDVCV